MISRRGFTLIELLVALIVLGIILAGSAMILRTYVAADRELSDTSMLYSRVRSAYELMLLELRHARSVETGHEGDLTVRAAIESQSHRYSYRLEEYGGENWLVRSVDEGAPERVIPSIVQLRFTYVTEGGVVLPPPVTPDQDVRAVDVELSARLPGGTLPIRFINRVSLRNL